MLQMLKKFTGSLVEILLVGVLFMIIAVAVVAAVEETLFTHSTSTMQVDQ